MKLNLACGEKKREGWVNVDISPDCDPDEVVNLFNFPWAINLHPMGRGIITPFVEENSIDEIYCSHFIEHIGDELIPFMEECYRVLKPDGIAHFEMPYYTSIRAWQDPTHKRPISEFTFHYFNQKWLKEQGIGHYNIKADFKIETISYHYPPELKDMPKDELMSLQHHAWNTVMDFEVILKAIKSDSNNEKMDRKTPANGKSGLHP